MKKSEEGDEIEQDSLADYRYTSSDSLEDIEEESLNFSRKVSADNPQAEIVEESKDKRFKRVKNINCTF